MALREGSKGAAGMTGTLLLRGRSLGGMSLPPAPPLSACEGTGCASVAAWHTREDLRVVANLAKELRRRDALRSRES